MCIILKYCIDFGNIGILFRKMRFLSIDYYGIIIVEMQQCLKNSICSLLQSILVYNNNNELTSFYSFIVYEIGF